VTIRTLTLRDAPLVNERWMSRSATSLAMIEHMISSVPTSGSLGTAVSCCCLGIEVDGALRAWILQYLDGPFGMLYCEEPFRRRGLAGALVAEAVDRVGRRLQRQQWRQEEEEGRRGGADEKGKNSGSAAGASSSFVCAYIVDGNTGSENLFRLLGWERVRSVNWVGFSGSLLSPATTPIE